MTDRIAELEARLQRLEDEREITRLITSYGPLVDAGVAEEVADIWTEDGIYDVDEVYLAGRQQLEAMVRSRGHQSWINNGAAHFLGPAHVTVTGDEAYAVGHSLMVVLEDGVYRVRRAGAHHWAFARTPDGWRATRRVARVLDGAAEAHGLLVSGVHGEPAVVDEAAPRRRPS